MAATETAPTETQQGTATFIAFHDTKQVLTRRAARHVPDPITGKYIAVNEAEWMARQTEEHGEGNFDETPWKVEFGKDDPPGMFSTDNPELIAWLRGHDKFNTQGPSGFFEEGVAPDEPEPRLADQIKAIAEASAQFDVERLRQVRQLELDTHERSSIIGAADAALATLGESSGLGDDAGTGNGDPSSTSPD